MYTIDLSGNVTIYGQEQTNWCGAASAQMTRNGYPNPAERYLYNQADLWNTIQIYNSTNATDVSRHWNTDPHGMTGCLQNLANPTGVQWNELSEAARDMVLFGILYWMNVRGFPSPVLVNAGWHWMVVVGWTTDVEPVAGSSPVLQSIEVYDTEPRNVGSYHSYTGPQWYAGHWCFAVNVGGTWLNKYVAVGEPPVPPGRVRVNEVDRTGTSVLTPDQALASARRAIQEEQLGDKPKFALLRREDAVTAAPLLVRDEMAGGDAQNVPHYYIVGFGLRGETDNRGERMVRVAVLVNAYSGALEEVTAFGEPVRYLTEAEAKAIVARAMHLEPEQVGDASATLMFRPGDITHIRSYPFWRVTVGEKNVYVDQLGHVYTKLILSTPGD